MKPEIERRWTSLLDSAGWRRASRLVRVRSLMESRPGRAVDLARRRLTMARRAASSPDMFASVHTLCLLVGHTKSGGSMLGSLLDAHPRIAMADELDVLKYVDAGFEAELIFHQIEKSAHREALKGRVTARRLGAYSFAVPGQWQGRHDAVQVVGDAKAGITTQRLGRDPAALDRLRDLLGDVSLKLIQVVRNPFDPIAAMHLRSGRALADAADRYFANCEILNGLHEAVAADDLMVVPYERMVWRTRETLGEVGGFVGVQCPDDYLAACAGVVDDQSPREREQVSWNDTVVADIERQIELFPFLAGYGFDS